jgi:hypothetical protein
VKTARNALRKNCYRHGDSRYTIIPNNYSSHRHDATSGFSNDAKGSKGGPGGRRRWGSHGKDGYGNLLFFLEFLNFFISSISEFLYFYFSFLYFFRAGTFFILESVLRFSDFSICRFFNNFSTIFESKVAARGASLDAFRLAMIVTINAQGRGAAATT